MKLKALRLKAPPDRRDAVRQSARVLPIQSNGAPQVFEGVARAVLRERPPCYFAMTPPVVVARNLAIALGFRTKSDDGLGHSAAEHQYGREIVRGAQNSGPHMFDVEGPFAGIPAHAARIECREIRRCAAFAENGVARHRNKVPQIAAYFALVFFGESTVT